MEMEDIGRDTIFRHLQVIPANRYPVLNVSGGLY